MPGVNYGTGSRQNAVTGADEPTFSNTNFVVMTRKTQVLSRGAGVKCGSVVRLKLSGENLFLHSHKAFESPLSGNQEVTGFEVLDSGDEWQVECIAAENKEKSTEDNLWLREMPIKLKHVDTGKYLQMLPNKAYDRPISGHLEVSCAKAPEKNNHVFIAMEGFYFNQQKD
ncbi:Stromal cell-derived factor 2 [Smittium mucronatum]|uniref:Stromal cell-derived factor 2 n=1 Tax=Smittium mucronatum TaxID=133383 RepID=A0A1R0GQA6_9FUNG|nr:Stromal cell-derived factor 2 [Smittium mucronatum]